MKNLVRSVTSLLLITMMFTMMLPMVFNSSVGAQEKRKLDLQENELPDRLPPGVVKGESVRLRINRQRVTNKALDRAMKDKERLGKRIKWDATAIFIFSEPKKETTAQLNVPQMRYASLSPFDQQTLSDGTGEATFITYEGAGNTWDGTVSVTDYYTGENRVYNSDMSDFGAPDDPAVWDVTNEIYYPPSGGDPTQCPPDRPCLEQPVVSQKHGTDSSAASLMNVSYARATTSPAPVGPVFRWFSNFWRCYSRTAAFVGRQCVSPQPNIRNNLICAIAAGIYAAGCCARFAHQNAGQGRCYP